MKNIEKNKVLSVNNLVISFKTDRGIVHAVRGVSFDLYKGETLCIVGESGSGKSVTNKAIMGISAANAIIESGSIMYEGEDLTRVSEEEFHRIRGHKIGMIFQDPLSALNPIMKVGKQITEATMVSRNILKRYYGECISKELIALRNVEANTDFEIKKCKDQIEKNGVFSVQYKGFLKTLLSIEKNINKLNEKGYSSLKNKYNEEEVEFNNYKEVILDYFAVVARTYDEDIANGNKIIEHCKENISKIEKEEQTKETINRIQIQNNRIKRYAERVEVYSRLKETKFDLNDIVESLKIRNTQLKELIKIFKKECKEALPALKTALKFSKAKAKIATQKYADELKAARDEKIAKVQSELDACNQDILELRATLEVSELAKIDEILAKNLLTKKAIIKKENSFKENSISKTTKEELKLVSTGSAKYDELMKKVEKFEKEIALIQEEYIKSTKITKKEAKKMALEVMKEVGIPLPEKRYKQYPFEFSGGMRQRIVIAIALTANPDILICDEPTTALDVTIQAQILDLINKLKAERGLSCIFITHDLGVVAHMADRVAVMYAGKIVEYGTADEVFFDPKHPYTWALLSSIPDINSKEKLEAIPGTPPDMLYPPKGDAFALRSKYAMKIDFEYEPPFFKVSDTHFASTWLLYKDAPEVEMPKIVKTRIEVALKEAAEFEDIEKIKSEIAETVAKKGVIKNAK